MVITKTCTEPKICKREILRYAGCTIKEGQDSEQLETLLNECLEEALPKLRYQVCCIKLPLDIREDICDFGCLVLKSKDLAKNLAGCQEVLLFGATIGIEIDRLIMKYGRTSPTKALLMQAIGAERIEALCDVFCEGLRPRFSPGYGDLSLETQKEIFQVLNCNKYVGITLNESYLMSPSKSVTAIVGLGKWDSKTGKNKCALCDKRDCAYRGV